MDAMRESMEKERESLNKSDAVALKGRELSLSKELTEHQALFNKKKSSLAVKEDQYIDLQNRKKVGGRPKLREGDTDQGSFRRNAVICG